MSLSKIAGIQYLRAIAAIAVVIDHTVGMASFDKYMNVRAPYFEFWINGAFGVNLFFVISGFIMVASSIDEQSLKSRRTFFEFISARVIRIFPMMWLAIGSYYLLRSFGRGASGEIKPYINAFFLLPFNDYEPKNIWTLRHEITFYLVFGLTFLLPIRAVYIFLLWVVAPFLLLIKNLFNIEYDANLQEVINNVLHPVNILFGVGVLLGFIHQKYKFQINNLKNALTAWMQNWFFLASVFIFIMYITSAYFPNAKTGDVLMIIYTLPVFAFMVFVGSIKTNYTNKTMYYLGNASFAIYLFHPHFISAMLGIFAKTAPNMPIVLVVALVSSVSVAIGCIIYSFIESPVTKILHQVIKNNRRSPE